ncbi:HD-GYP domain-containing protein [Eubacterium oxidoreducens]|uniref:HDIG domain-containing protein n=1 Tax=Eubacterium oxidoreducens TaxID=1732 RepID=A0A1G5ZZR4_EUBOX|nr:HD domain-containing phosphohydrolase [Eubacterium oxidoreducens]SDB01699.1 HDIG domain-containing protein [Eubacterium oxidoreducens]
MEKKSSLEVIEAIASLLDAKNTETEGHSKRVALIVVIMGKQMGMKGKDLEQLERMARLHDIGKLGIPDNILNKPSMLTEEEFTIMKSHTVIGADILTNLNNSKLYVMAAKFHHERYDGKGYYGMYCEELPLSIRILALADALDAMTSYRRYQRNVDTKEAIAGELLKGRGTQFDPVVTDVAISCLRDGRFDAILQEAKDIHEKQMRMGDRMHYVGWSLDSYTPKCWSRFVPLEYMAKQITEYERLSSFHGILGIMEMDNFDDLIANEGHRAADLKLFSFCDRVCEILNSSEIISRVSENRILVYMENNHKLKLRYQEIQKMADILGVSIVAGLAVNEKKWNFKAALDRARCALYHAKLCNLKLYMEENVKKDLPKDIGLEADRKLIEREIPLSERVGKTLALITITPIRNDVFDMERMDEVVYTLEDNFIRKLDDTIRTKRFSSNQIVLVKETMNKEDVEELLEWNISEYFRLSQITEFEIQWEIL